MKYILVKRSLIFFSLYFTMTTLPAQQKHEFRAVWIATVDNIDWPGKGNYNSDSQKREYIRLLDLHKNNGMNAVIVQVRPSTDAFYPSPYEPWSEWLTGKQGRPPVPYYDPLQFMIEETHKRGMEFHAWCNPYRAEFKLGRSSIASAHITKLHPEWFLKYGDKRYFDPGNKNAQEFVVKVIRDIVQRYDVDAIHFDDYFYPYRIAGKEFPDSVSFHRYGLGMDKNAWRRSNVDSVILKLSRAIKEENSHCRFGISPFGVWRNKKDDPDGSETTAGQTNYDDLYADILLWLKSDWIDYVAPQIYWEFGHKAAAYEVLLDWWSRHTYGKHCYIGLGIYRAGSSAPWKDSTLIPRQLQALRNYPQVQGAIYFSSKTFFRNPNGWNDSLRRNYYSHPALIPPMKYLTIAKPSKPIIKSTTRTLDSMSLTIEPGSTSDEVKQYAVYAFRNLAVENNSIEDGNNLLYVIPMGEINNKSFKIPFIEKDSYLLITAINILNEESDPVEVQLGNNFAVKDSFFCRASGYSKKGSAAGSFPALAQIKWY